jgi:hypothetical protein
MNVLGESIRGFASSPFFFVFRPFLFSENGGFSFVFFLLSSTA